MTDEISPLGENSLPIKELPVEDKNKPSAATEKVSVVVTKSNRLVPILITIIIFLIILFVAFVYLQIPKKTVSPSPLPSPSAAMSPLPSATDSGILKSVEQRLDDLDKNLNAFDINDSTLVFPILDFKVNFDKKK